MKFKRTFSVLIVAFVCSLLFASPLYYDKSYIQNYDIHIDVNKNNTYNIEENISYYFDTPSQGIYRVFPTRGYDNRKTIVSDFRSNANIATVEKQMNAVSYVLGKRGVYLTGLQKYNICYIFDVGEDKNKDFDAFYYNLIGSSWDVPIQNVTFTIVFPEDVDLKDSDIQFFRGTYGKTDTKRIFYTVDKNVISGYANDFGRTEALTSLVGLSDGYFVGARKEAPLEAICLSLLIVILVVTTVLLLVMYIKSPHSRFLTPVVSSYPKEGITPLDARYLYKKETDAKALSGAILNFAENGFLSIEFNEKKNAFSKDEIILHKTEKDAENLSREEEILLSSIFKNSNDVNLNDPNLALGTTLSTIRGTLCAMYSTGDKAMYEKNSVRRYHKSIFALIAEIVLAFGMLFLSFSQVLGVVAPSAFRYTAIISFFVALIVDIFVILKIRKKSEFYASSMENLLGLKDFIETVEKEKLETLINEDPHYFYKTLAYAIPLECEKKWTAKFEKGIKLEQPEWFSGNFSVFDYMLFAHFTRSFYSYVPTNIKVSDFGGVAKGGGGLSMGGGGIGGGFSGGGFGGGGGGRW